MRAAAVGLSVAALLLVAGPSGATARRRPSDVSGAVLTLGDMPTAWSVYVQPATSPGVRRTKGTCGGPYRAPTPTEAEPTAAFALDDDAGPVFGERIERYAPGHAPATSAGLLRDMPCTRTDGPVRWRATPLRRVHLREADTEYLLRELSGPFPFTYNDEYRVWRGDDVIAVVLSSRTPDRKLAETLARRAVARYDASASG